MRIVIRLLSLGEREKRREREGGRERGREGGGEEGKRGIGEGRREREEGRE